MKFFRDSIEIIDVIVDNKTQLKQSLQGQDLIQANFTLENYFEFKIGDNVQWRNKKYTILDQPSVKKNKQNEFVYSFDLKSDQYRMESALYMSDGQTDFYLLGDLEKFANLIVVNLNRIFGADYYQLGTYPSTEVKNLSFQNTNCFNTLQRITQEFGLEYFFSQDGRTINLVSKIGNDTGLSFQYKYGLQRIERQKVNESNIVTKLYAFGGEKNISNDYGSKRLKVDPIEKNTNLFGTIEGVVTFDDIYPHREGVVSAIENDDIFKFTDSSIDFNVNDQLLEGVVAKVTFNTGQLAGYEFEISEYNHTSKRFTIISYEDSNGLVLPNETLKIQVGDKYVIHEIKMPQSYIDNAEALLQQKQQEYIDENSLPNVVYSIQPDRRYLRRHLIQFNVGDIIEIQDDDFNISYLTRIIDIVQGCGDAYSYTIKVGDNSTVGYIQRVLSNQLDINNTIAIDRQDSTVRYNQIRKNLKNIDELKESIFDPDGYFDPNNIKPLSIDTGMLAVGMKGQQFIIEELLIQANYLGNPSRIEIGAATLVHFTIDDTQIKEWNVSGLSVPGGLNATKVYYIYAQCSKTLNTGQFAVNENQIPTDNGDHYFFLIGVLHTPIDGVRGISLTYGQTTINGKFITTGRIQSSDGFNFFDLDDNKFYLGDANNGIDWNHTNPGKLTIRGGIVQRSTGETGVIPVHIGDWDAGTEYTLGDQVNHNGSTYQYIFSTPTENKMPPNSTYWMVAAAAGQDGAQGVPGQNGTNGTTTYTWIRYADDANGNGISNSPTGKEYIGFAYNKTTATESNTPADYTWSKILGDQGDQGVQGDPGANGETYYTWIKYSDNADGTGLYDTPTASTQYIGISVNNLSQTESTDKTDYVWSKFKGEDGADGDTGAAIVYRGDFDQTKIYYNNSERRDVVKYNSTYYIYKGTNGVALAWSASNWENFGAEFESIATNLLLAENANIADWIIKNGKITSQNEYNGNPIAQLNGELGQITLRSPKTTHTATAGTRTYEQTIEMDSVEGRVRSHRSGDSFQESAEAILDSDGLSVDYAGLDVDDPTVATLKAAVAANVKGKMSASAYGYLNPLVAVYGRAQNTDPNPGIAFGGYFYNLMAKGLFLNGFPRNGTYYVTDNDVYVPMKLTVSGNVYLPPNPIIGRTLLVKNVNNFSCTIHGNGHNIKRQGSTSTININYGEMAILWFDSSRWLCVLLL